MPRLHTRHTRCCYSGARPRSAEGRPQPPQQSPTQSQPYTSDSFPVHVHQLLRVAYVYPGIVSSVTFDRQQTSESNSKPSLTATSTTIGRTTQQRARSVLIHTRRRRRYLLAPFASVVSPPHGPTSISQSSLYLNSLLATSTSPRSPRLVAGVEVISRIQNSLSGASRVTIGCEPSAGSPHIRPATRVHGIDPPPVQPQL